MCMPKILKMRKRQRQHTLPQPASWKVLLMAEIVEFPNDPSKQPKPNEETRWLKLADAALIDKKIS